MLGAVEPRGPVRNDAVALGVGVAAQGAVRRLGEGAGQAGAAAELPLDRARADGEVANVGVEGAGEARLDDAQKPAGLVGTP